MPLQANFAAMSPASWSASASTRSTPAPGPAALGWSHGRRRHADRRRRNPATGEVIAHVRGAAAADYERVMRSRRRSGRRLARRARAAARRSRPPARRGAARAQGRARLAGRARDGQDQARGRRRSAGDDRHRRLRRRPVAHALRPDDALRAPAATACTSSGIRSASSASSPRSTSRSRSGPGTRSLAAVCGDISIWKPSPKTPLSAIAVA